MSRDSGGTYVLPAGNPVTPNTIIESAWANTTMPDLGNEITNSLDRNGRGGMLAPLKIFDGTVSAPGLGFTQDPNNGLARIGSDEWVLVAGGVMTMKLTPTLLTFYPALAFETTDPISFGGDITVGGTLTVNDGADITGQLNVTNPAGASAIHGYNGAATPTAGAMIARWYGYANTPTLGSKFGAGVEVVASENWTDTANGANVVVKAVKAGGTVTSVAAEIGANGSIFHNPISVRGTIDAAADTGIIQFGTSYAQYIQWDGANWNWTGNNWKTIGGNLAVSNALQYKTAQPVPISVNIGGVTTVNFSNGLVQILTMTVPGTVSFAGIPNGAIQRIVFINTNLGLTITGVNWPNGTAPAFDSGPLKQAIVVIMNVAGTLLGTYTAY